MILKSEANPAFRGDLWEALPHRFELYKSRDLLMWSKLENKSSRGNPLLLYIKMCVFSANLNTDAVGRPEAYNLPIYPGTFALDAVNTGSSQSSLAFNREWDKGVLWTKTK